MSIRRQLWLVMLAGGLAGACTDSVENPLGPDAPSFDVAVDAPAPLVTVAFGSWQAQLWPFTGTGLNSNPSDPINLVFPGRDAREVRAALMSLDGNRAAFGLPAAPPFNCTWKDAVGDAQLGYSQEAGWTGSAIQLECGDYAPMRFHVRLFDAGAATVGNAHFEVIVPGTNQHAVLSWELAEQLIKVDFVRSGLLDAAVPFALTALINPVPSWSTINPLIYNGLPVALRAAIGGPLANVSAPVPLPSDGRALILNLASAPEAAPGMVQRDFVIPFNQIIPKPFCASGPTDLVRVVGEVLVKQTILVTPGLVKTGFDARGTLQVTPFNPQTGSLGETYTAEVDEVHGNLASNGQTQVTMTRVHKLIGAAGQTSGTLTALLHVGGGQPKADLDVQCQ